MLKIILSGCHGKMGKVLQSMIAAKEEMTVVAGIDQNTDLPSDFPVYAQLALHLLACGHRYILFSPDKLH